MYYAFLQKQSKDWLLLKSYSSEKHVVRSLYIEKKKKQRNIKVTLGLPQGWSRQPQNDINQNSWFLAGIDPGTPLFQVRDLTVTLTCGILPQGTSQQYTHIYSTSINIFWPYGLGNELCNLKEDRQMVQDYFLIHLSIILTDIASKSERHHISYVVMVSWWPQVNLKSSGSVPNDIKHTPTTTTFPNKCHTIT